MSDYIREIRKFVGHRPVLQCGASVIVVNPAGELLLQLRSDCMQWGYAGGAVELYERVEDAAARELKEETGLIADEMALMGIFSGQEMRHVYPNGDQVSNVDIVFVCKKYHGALRCQQGEVERLAFFPLDAMPESIFPANVPALRHYAKLHKEMDAT